MSEKKVQQITEIVEAMAVQFGATVEVEEVQRLAKQLAKDLGIKKVEAGTPTKANGAKLTPTKVRNIRRAVEAGASQAAMAKKYKVTAGTINQIVHRRIWTNV